MARIVSILSVVLFFSVSGFAQGWDWGRGSVGSNIVSWPVATDTSGNVFVAGVSSGAVSYDNDSPSFISTGHQCVIAKYDSRGDFLWARSTQNGPRTSLIGITTDLAGNCYLLGWMPDSSMEIGSFTLHNTIYPHTQYFIAKYDFQGNVLWAKNDGGRSGNEAISPIILDSASTVKMLSLGAISSDKDGNIYIATGFNLPSVIIGNDTLINESTLGGTDDIMLAKYDNSGNVMWAKSSGGNSEDIPFGLTVTPSGSIYIAGIFNSDSIAFGSSVIKDTSMELQKWNAFIARYNTLGEPVWANSSNGAGKVYSSGIVSDANNNVYLTGGFAESNISFGGINIVNFYPGRPVSYLVKIDTSNKAKWYQIMGSLTGTVWGYAAAAFSGGSVWVSGGFNNDVDGILDTPAASIDPVFIIGFDTAGHYIGSAALQSGSSQQSGLACDIGGSVYLCADYKYPCSPFIIADNVLADIPLNNEWQYLAKYGFGGGVPGSGFGTGPQTSYNSYNVSMCPYDSTSLVAPQGYAIYRWNDGSSDTLLHITEAGTYWVTAVGKEDSMVVDTFNVKTDVALCDCGVFLPSAFTPNRDQRNDTYGPIFNSGCSITSYAFAIYNRWGQRVFYSENPDDKWDGTFEGVNADLGVYMFYLKYGTNPSYPEHTKKGDVTLIR